MIKKLSKIFTSLLQAFTVEDEQRKVRTTFEEFRWISMVTIHPASFAGEMIALQQDHHIIY